MDVRGRRVLVMGLGNFSGGVSAARFMARRGARVLVTDLAPPEHLASSVAALEGEPIEAMRLGGHQAEDFRWAELVVTSPAVRRDDPFLRIARAAGARVTSEMNLFFQLCPAPVVGVTGSNGKSTTAAMIQAMLQAAGRPCWLGGNIGRSLLDSVDAIRTDDLVVLELSSFQLEELDELARSPHVAVVTTFTPNHLDRHPTLDAYRRAKQTILRHQRPGDLAALNADDPEVRAWPTRCRTLWYGLDDHGHEGSFLDGERAVVRLKGREVEFELLGAMRLCGVHNRSNALAAGCVAAALGVDARSIRDALASFHTLPHRLEPIAEVDGRWFYDDSIATTPESTLAALAALEAPVWLIAGGHDKGLDLNEVAQRIAERVKGVALLGQTAPVLRELVGRHSPAGRVPAMQEFTHMDGAVAWCYHRSEPGDVILLSPACASFGMFRNFVDRAEAFRRAIFQIQAPLRQAG
jgi:UDP-N-acetylmuramoylalanine--D-glutamate ligase